MLCALGMIDKQHVGHYGSLILDVLCITLVCYVDLLHVILIKVLYDVQHVHVLSACVGSCPIQYWWKQLHIHLHTFWCCDAFTDTQQQ